MLDSPRRYSSPAIVLHWITALLMAAVLLLPLYWEQLEGPVKRDYVNLHKSIGVVIIVVAVIRLAWRFIDPPPELPAENAPWIRLSAMAGHVLLYVLMLGLPVLGVLFSWANGRPVPVFGLFEIPAPYEANKALGHTLEEIHVWVGLTALPAMILLHAVAAFWHHYVLKDGLLFRIIPR